MLASERAVQEWVSKSGKYPTDPFTILEHQNPSIDESELQKIRQSRSSKIVKEPVGYLERTKTSTLEMDIYQKNKQALC